ncbi:MAG: hypothetical protein LBD25_07310, partial [Coriobacteriales bacterium]|nr:hypothetical protein [Coriobacteriales bacterium]
ARATAGEIGWPLIELVADIDEAGNGSIKVSGPVKRSLFGSPRLTDVPSPCVLMIQNIDQLQALFRGEERSIGHTSRILGSSSDAGGHQFGSGGFGQGGHGSGQSNPLVPMGFIQRSMQAEVLGYLRALRSHGKVFFIVTAAEHVETSPSESLPRLGLFGQAEASSGDPGLDSMASGTGSGGFSHRGSGDAHGQLPVTGVPPLDKPLSELIGTHRVIEVPPPTLAERSEILRNFAREHPSFKEVDFEYLAALTRGIARSQLLKVALSAVEEAYRESLRAGKHKMVSLGEALSHIVSHIDPGSPYREQVENIIVEQFSSELRDDLSFM